MANRRESRVSAIVTLIAVAVLLAVFPHRFSFVPPALMYGLCILVILAMIAAQVAPIGSVWPTVERWIVIGFVCIGLTGELVVLRGLINDIIYHVRQLSPITLLATAVGIWVANVLLFALIYWQLDRGGPDGRARAWKGRADFSFPHGNPSDGVPVDWSPTFLDYLYVAFTASTAFSPCDELPLTIRIKMLMMTQSIISLVTIVIVAARAINILV